MKKLLGLAICFAVIITMGAGLTGCNKEDPKVVEAQKKAKALEEAEKAKTEVKLKTASLELKAKTKDQEFDIEVTEKVADKIEFQISGEKITGTGSIAKDATTGKVKITTEEGAKDGELTFLVEGAKSKGSPKLKATVK